MPATVLDSTDPWVPQAEPGMRLAQVKRAAGTRASRNPSDSRFRNGSTVPQAPTPMPVAKNDPTQYLLPEARQHCVIPPPVGVRAQQPDLPMSVRLVATVPAAMVFTS